MKANPVRLSVMTSAPSNRPRPRPSSSINRAGPPRLRPAEERDGERRGIQPSAFSLQPFRLLCCLFLLSASPLFAATLHASLDSTNPTAPYATWATAATNIEHAVDTAQTGDTVLVTNGLYNVGNRDGNRVAITNAGAAGPRAAPSTTASSTTTRLPTPTTVEILSLSTRRLATSVCGPTRPALTRAPTSLTWPPPTSRACPASWTATTTGSPGSTWELTCSIRIGSRPRWN